MGLLHAVLLVFVVGFFGSSCVVYFEEEDVQVTYSLDAERKPMKVSYLNANGDTISVMSRDGTHWEHRMTAEAGTELYLSAQHTHVAADTTRPNTARLAILVNRLPQVNEEFTVDFMEIVEIRSRVP